MELLTYMHRISLEGYSTTIRQHRLTLGKESQGVGVGRKLNCIPLLSLSFEPCECNYLPKKL